MIIYKDVIKRLKDAGYNTGRIMSQKLLPQSTMDALRHNKPLSLRSIDAICRLAKCQPGDILEYVEDPSQTPED